MRRTRTCKSKKENKMNDLHDPLAIARALGVYEDEPEAPEYRIPREVTIHLLVLVLSAYVVLTLGVYIGLLIHP